MPKAHNGDTALEYDTFGNSADPALMLIMGYTAQMTSWDVDFCDLLVSKGHFVIRFDNRDSGLSTKSDGPKPNVMAMLTKAVKGEPITEDVPYTLSDMAHDGIAVLDALGVERAHVLGASMGGMIAQQLAIDHPSRVLALTSIMSSTGALGVGQATPEAQVALFTPPPTDRDDVIEHTINVSRVISGPLFDEHAIRKRSAAAYDRSYHPAGGAFQMAAIAKTGDRTERLRTLGVPTLVIHGQVDPLIDPSGGVATAEAIPDARLVLVDDMGHDLPGPLWPLLTDAIADLSAKVAESAR